MNEEVRCSRCTKKLGELHGDVFESVNRGTRQRVIGIASINITCGKCGQVNEVILNSFGKKDRQDLTGPKGADKVCGS